jgi:Cys-tRNA(Pro) deacylase
MKGAGTPATVFLAEHGVAYTEHLYEYVEHGGTGVSSSALGVPEHHVVKTLVMETDAGDPLIVLMHGDRKVATKELARVAGVKRIFPCKPDVAQRHSGYLVGGTTPFGTRRKMPVYLERSVLDLETLYINGGRRGYLLAMKPAELQRVLAPILVDAALVE